MSERDAIDSIVAAVVAPSWQATVDVVTLAQPEQSQTPQIQNAPLRYIARAVSRTTPSDNPLHFRSVPTFQIRGDWQLPSSVRVANSSPATMLILARLGLQ